MVCSTLLMKQPKYAWVFGAGKDSCHNFQQECLQLLSGFAWTSKGLWSCCMWSFAQEWGAAWHVELVKCVFFARLGWWKPEYLFLISSIKIQSDFDTYCNQCHKMTRSTPTGSMGLIWIDISTMGLTYKSTIHVYANIPILSHPMDPMGRQCRSASIVITPWNTPRWRLRWPVNQCNLVHLSNKINPGCFGYMGDYTTQLYGDNDKPL